METRKKLDTHSDLYHIDISNVESAAIDVSKKASKYLPMGSDISFKLVFVGSVGKSFTVDVKTPGSAEILKSYGLTKEHHRFYAADSMNDGWLWRFDDEDNVRHQGELHPVLVEVLNKYMYLTMDIVENNEIIEPYHSNEYDFNFTIKVDDKSVSIEHEVNEHIARFSIKAGDISDLVCVQFIDDGNTDSQLELPAIKNLLLLKTLQPMARHYGS